MPVCEQRAVRRSGAELSSQTAKMSISRVETTGASSATAKQDGLEYSGVRASHQMAETDAGRVGHYRSHITRAAQKHGVDAALIAAIMSRESRAGNALKSGWGDHGRAWGLMQVDITPNGGNHPKIGGWDSYEHVDHATGILTSFIGKIGRKFSDWSAEQKLKGGIAAYNMGERSVQSYHEVDANTTGGDYSNDVVARAQWYKTNVRL